MLILVHGKDTYRAKEKIKELLADKKFDSLEELDFLYLKEQLGTGSLFNKEKIILLRDAFSDNNFKQEFVENADKLNHKNDLVVLWENRKILAKEKLDRFFEKTFCFEPLKRKELEEWIRSYLKNFSIDKQALSLLIDSSDNDLWRLSLELDKLMSYCFEKKEISKKDVDLLVKKTFQADIFKTLEAAAKKDKKTALKLLHSHLEKGDSPFYLLSMFYYQFRTLIIVKELEEKGLAEATRLLKPMHPFAVKKAYYLGKEFEMKKLKNVYSKLFKLDLAVKKGKIKPELALELLIADI